MLNAVWNCQLDWANKAAAWSLEQPAAKTNWLIITCSLNAEFSIMSISPNGRCSRPAEGAAEFLTVCVRFLRNIYWNTAFDFHRKILLLTNQFVIDNLIRSYYFSWGNWTDQFEHSSFFRKFFPDDLYGLPGQLRCWRRQFALFSALTPKYSSKKAKKRVNY